MNNETVQIRIDQKTKLAAQKAFKSMGMDMSSGVKMFLTQVVKDQCFPFIPSTKKTIALRKKWDKEVAEALKNGKRYTSTKEMMDDILV
ncbi:type II toxin-antitoxin system RelB/DinJ family antitoxin [Candidatus Nomurabacteria bacterium]|nr:type II toxin-antitoxin system RelB/DinJ family antitoxin [Candidatus Nomurabacteria bacterium]